MYSKQSINTSSEALNQNAKYQQDRKAIDMVEKVQKKAARQEGLSHLYNSDYKPASYKKALEFRDSMSYRKKIA